MSTALFGNLTNEELRSELEKHGVEVGPVTTTTRKVYEIKLLKIVQKKENAEEFVQNLSVSDKNGRGATPEPNAVPAANGDAGNNGCMSLRSGSPMARNGSPMPRNGSPMARNGSPMVRNDYPLAHNGSPTLGNGSFAGNNVSTDNSKKLAVRNAMREKKLLLNNTSEVFVAVQESSAGAAMNNSIGQIISQQKNPVEDHNYDYSEDDGNESARFLSPEEVAKFRSGFSSLNNTDELISGIAGATSEASSSMFSPYSQLNGRSKRRPPASTIVVKPAKGGFFSRAAATPLLVVVLLFFAVGLVVVFQANLTYLSGYGSSPLYKDEI